jgi:hypothetical protein
MAVHLSHKLCSIVRLIIKFLVILSCTRYFYFYYLNKPVFNSAQKIKYSTEQERALFTKPQLSVY